MNVCYFPVYIIMELDASCCYNLQTYSIKNIVRKTFDTLILTYLNMTAGGTARSDAVLVVEDWQQTTLFRIVPSLSFNTLSSCL